MLGRRSLLTNQELSVRKHPNERRKKNVSTVPLLKLALKNVQVVCGYSFVPEALPLMQQVFDDGRKPLLLYPSDDAISLDGNRSGEVHNNANANSDNLHNDCADGEDLGRPHEVNGHGDLLVIIDGTWAEAKRIVRDSPGLLECCQKIQFTSVIYLLELLLCFFQNLSCNLVARY